MVADLIIRATGAVPPSFFMELVPDLELSAIALEQGRRLWGLDPIRVPHWENSVDLRDGRFCPPDHTFPVIGLRDVHAYVLSKTDAKSVVTGAKRADGMWRRTWFSTTGSFGMTHPIADWSRLDVLAYLKMRGIEIPSALGREGKTSSGISLDPGFLIWCHKEFPRDFERIAEVFPYVEAVIWREKFYGTEGGTEGAPEGSEGGRSKLPDGADQAVANREGRLQSAHHLG